MITKKIKYDDVRKIKSKKERIKTMAKLRPERTRMISMRMAESMCRDVENFADQHGLMSVTTAIRVIVLEFFMHGDLIDLAGVVKGLIAKMREDMKDLKTANIDLRERVDFLLSELYVKKGKHRELVV